MAQLRMSEELWVRTWLGLRERGGGRRESAAVWIGTRSEAVESAEDVLFLDDLAGVRAHALQHCVPRTATSALFRELRARGKVIVGDVHTHPANWVDLSPTDEEHPIEYRVGLVAVVVPSFAIGEPAIEGVGIHVYRGAGSWDTPRGPGRLAALLVGPGAP